MGAPGSAPVSCRIHLSISNERPAVSGTGTNVSKLSRSVRSLLLTGRPGVGKTTLVERVAAELGSRGLRLAGFTTRELRRGPERVGFELGSLGGPERAVLAHVDRSEGPRVGRYRVDVEALDRFVARALVPPADVFFIDEIGKMECFSTEFVAAVKKLLGGPAPVVATVALHGGGLIAEVKARRDIELWEVTEKNRDELGTKVAAWVVSRS